MKAIWKFILVLILAQGFTVPLQAQKEDVPYRHIVKFAPLAFIGPTPAFQFGYEYRINPKYSIHAEAGLINNWAVEWNTHEFENMLGYRVRVEPRLFIGTGSSAGYLAPEIFISNHTFERTRTYGFNCFNGDCDYFQVVTYNGRRQDTGFHIKGGTMVPLDMKNRLWLDIYFGLGARFRKVETWNRPVNGIRIHWDFPYANNKLAQWIPSAAAGFKLGYRIR